MTVQLVWGASAVRALAPQDAVVIIDVLSFSTAVNIAVSRGSLVFPGDPAGGPGRARAVDAVWTGPRGTPGSLSPHALLTQPIPPRMMLSSMNGAVAARAATERAAVVLAGCLRNAQAVAAYLRHYHAAEAIAVVAAGERWPDGELRPALEDLLAAGAICSGLPELWLTPAARAASAAYQALRPDLAAVVRASHSAQELMQRGFSQDVDAALAHNVSDLVPILEDGAFRPARTTRDA